MMQLALHPIFLCLRLCPVNDEEAIGHRYAIPENDVYKLQQS